MWGVSFLVLCYLRLVHVHVQAHSCPPSFSCGKLGDLGFPFTSESCPRSGWLPLSSCGRDAPTVQLEQGARTRYEVDHISQANIIRINDTSLRQSLTSKSCQYFEHLALPLPTNASFLSFDFVEGSLPMLKCHSHSLPPLGKHLLHANCSAPFGYSVYYSHHHHFGSITPPPHCSFIHLPAAANGSASDDLYTLLSAQFSLRVEIHPECVGCLHIGGLCDHDHTKGKFHCAKKGKAKSGLKLGLALGFSIGWLLILAIYFLWHIRRRHQRRVSASREHTRNCFSDSSSRADPEEGSIHNRVYIFTYSELEEATSHFKESNEIGCGRFGATYYGKLGDGREVAVKRLCVYSCTRLEQLMKEIETLSRLRHKNLVSLYGCTASCSRELLLVYDFIPNGTIASHLNKAASSMTWPVRMSIAIQTASALAYLHASHTMHGDLKTDNILLDNNLCVKVSGFQLSRLFPVDLTHASTAPLGTPGYVDPEYLRCFLLTQESDVYSFGVVLLELISSLPAFDTSRHRDELRLADLAISKAQEGSFNEVVDPSLGFGKHEGTRNMIMLVAELAFRCLQQDKDMRPDMAEVKQSLKMIRSGEGKSDDLIK